MAGWLDKSDKASSEEKIVPRSKDMKASHADNPKAHKEARRAEMMARMRRKCGGQV